MDCKIIKKYENLLLERIKTKIKKAEIISFDIFDTLLVRPYIKPTDLFLHIEQSLNCKGFALERIDAERRARIHHRELEDITLDMIYDEIDEEFKHLKQKEMDWEEMILRANPEVKQVYDYALKLGKKIVIVSDMYMPSAFLAKALRKNGYDNWEKLYVSGELGIKKGSGTLFNMLLEDLRVRPHNILHIGDNLNSDFSRPKEKGINAFLYKPVLRQFIEFDKRIENFVNQSGNKLGASILCAFLANKWNENKCSNKKEDYWYWLGYNYAGPVAYGYTRFIEQEAIKNKIDHLLFVARDGFTLQKVFDVFNKKIKTSYIYASRFISHTSRLVISEDYIGEFDKIIDYLIKTDEKLKIYAKNFYIAGCLNHKGFAEKYSYEINDIIENNLNNYKKYLAKNIDNNQNLGIIDTITANFSSQNLLENVLDKNLFGFYWGILNRNIHSRYKFTMFTPFNDTCIHRNDTTAYKTFTKNWDFMEFLLSSPEFPIKTISSEHKPIYEDNPNIYEKRRAKIYPNISLGAVNFTEEIKNLFSNSDIYLTSEELIKFINSFIDYPKGRDIKEFTKIKFSTESSNNYYYPLFSTKISLFDLIFRSKKSKQIIRKLYWQTRFQKLYLKYWGVYNENRKNFKLKRFFGITIYKKSIEGSTVKKSKLFGLVKSVKNNERKKRYFCGIKIQDKEVNLTLKDLQELLNKTANDIGLKAQRAISVALLHQKTFGEFRNKHQNETLALVGAGPSVKYLEPIKGIRYVGLNRAYLQDKIKFDYLFTIDKVGLDTGNEQFYDGFLNYDCIKFIGDQNLGIAYQHPQDIMYLDNRVRRYKTTAGYLPHKIALDIDTEALANSCSASIQAMQFIMFTNPKKVYIYGIDCTCASKQHFAGSAYDNEKRNENLKNNDKNHINDWKKIKVFAQTYYPKTEIIIVNPVGLKGIFKEVYTKSYLEKHPEIDIRNVEILDTNNENKKEELKCLR